MIKLKNILNEIQIKPNRKIVYAVSDENGSFVELIVLKSSQIIDDSEGTEDGVEICKFREESGKEDEFYYIGKIEI